MEQKFFYLGVDLGQQRDYTAICLLEKSFHLDARPGSYKQVARYSCSHLERFRDVSYPSVADRVKVLYRNPRLHDAKLIVDATAVGKPVCDLFEEQGLDPIKVTISGGTSVREHDDNEYSVPKRDLVSSLMVLFQSQALRISSKLELAPVLAEELQNFRAKIDIRTGHESYEHWREGMHDDLVLALSLCAWYGEFQDDRTSNLTSLRPSPARSANYDPLTWKTKRERR